MCKLVAGAAALVMMVCSGCASITQGTTHSLRIDTETVQGQPIDGADCELTNDQGMTIARSGGASLVRRSSKDLEIRCTSPGLPDASARLVSRANAGLAGNILLGGAIGAALDHGSGAAYTYPTWIKLVFGEHAVLDRRDEREGTALAATPGSATTVAHTVGAGAVALRTTAPAPRAGTPLARGDSFDYRIVDRATQNAQTVTLRVDQADDQQVSFNSGARVEKPNGELVRIASLLLGELDSVTPPGGWMPGGRVRRGMWPIKISRGSKRYDLTVQVGGEHAIRVAAGSFQAVRVEIEGWLSQGGPHVRGPYRATLWMSQELRRPIRFEVKCRSMTNTGGTFFMIDETAELIAISRD
jgi:hypothetical protein